MKVIQVHKYKVPSFTIDIFDDFNFRLIIMETDDQALRYPMITCGLFCPSCASYAQNLRDRHNKIFDLPITALS